MNGATWSLVGALLQASEPQTSLGVVRLLKRVLHCGTGLRSPRFQTEAE